MVKMVAFFKRKPGVSVEDFQHYWRATHAALVVKLPGIRRYVQSHTLRSGYRKGEPAYDGVAEVWFDDTDAMRAVAQISAYTAVRADEANFLDLSTMGSIITEEYIIKDGPIPPHGVKNIEFVTHPVVRRYVQSHTRKSIYASGKTPLYDGVALTWFDDTQAKRVSATTPEYARTRADEIHFIAPGALPFIITKEHVIVA